MKHLLIVGKSYSGLVHKINELGHDYTVLQDVLKTKYPERVMKHRVVADFSSTAQLFLTVDALHARKKIDGVITIYEDYVLATALVAEHLNLPHLPVEAAQAATDKYTMRTLFQNAKEYISPEFSRVESEDDLRLFAKTHAFPLILKPANLAKSLLVTKNDSLEELVRNYRKAQSLLETTYKKYAPNRTPSMIIEEYLDGTIHSVEAFVDSNGKPLILDEIVDYATGHDIGYDDNFHYSRILPSALSEEEQSALRKCAQLGVEALGMKNSAAHIEIIMTKNGPRIVEIGARNGGYRERMHALANEIDLLQGSIALSLGEPVHITSKRKDSVAVLELFPKEPGIFIGIQNAEAAEKRPSVHYFSVKAKEGQYVGKSGEGYKMCAVIILHHSDPSLFSQDLEFINEHVYVRTNASGASAPV